MPPKLAVLLAIVLVAVACDSLYGQDSHAVDEVADRLATAIDSGSVAAVRRVLDEGVSPDKLIYGSPPLMWAIWDERYYVVKLLLDRGADVNLSDGDGFTPLMSACTVGHARIVQLLIDQGAEVNAIERTYGMSPLQAACEGGSVPTVRLLIERGANVRHTDKYGGNCLEEAAFYGHSAIVELLREKGLTSEWSLHIAAGLGDTRKVKQQLAQDIDVNLANERWQNTPLHFAAGGGQQHVAQILVDRGARLEAKNAIGATPLHAAAGADHLKLVEWLVERGAEVNAADNNGSTPLDWTVGESVYQYLQEQGAEHAEYQVDAGG